MKKQILFTIAISLSMFPLKAYTQTPASEQLYECTPIEQQVDPVVTAPSKASKVDSSNSNISDQDGNLDPIDLDGDGKLEQALSAINADGSMSFFVIDNEGYKTSIFTTPILELSMYYTVKVGNKHYIRVILQKGSGHYYAIDFSYHGRGKVSACKLSGNAKKIFDDVIAKGIARTKAEAEKAKNNH